MGVRRGHYRPTLGESMAGVRPQVTPLSPSESGLSLALEHVLGRFRRARGGRHIDTDDTVGESDVAASDWSTRVSRCN